MNCWLLAQCYNKAYSTYSIVWCFQLLLVLLCSQWRRLNWYQVPCKNRFCRMWRRKSLFQCLADFSKTCSIKISVLSPEFCSYILHIVIEPQFKSQDSPKPWTGSGWGRPSPHIITIFLLSGTVTDEKRTHSNSKSNNAVLITPGKYLN